VAARESDRAAVNVGPSCPRIGTTVRRRAVPTHISATTSQAVLLSLALIWSCPEDTCRVLGLRIESLVGDCVVLATEFWVGLLVCVVY